VLLKLGLSAASFVIGDAVFGAVGSGNSGMTGFGGMGTGSVSCGSRRLVQKYIETGKYEPVKAT
jgi:hypothetical protein